MKTRPILSPYLGIHMLALTAALLVPACASVPTQRRASVLEYLYPQGKEATPSTDVSLALPLRVGIAFVPESGATARQGALPTGEKERLLERVRDAFIGTEGVSKIEIVPASYMVAGGGFENLEQIRAMLGLDIVALVSYDQTQFDEANTASITYWTIVGAYVIPGNEHETHTFVDASVFDIASRALLFNASGQSRVKDRSTAIAAERSLREDSAEGMRLAIDDMVAQLQVALERFREQAEDGTVRGAGTPAVSISANPGVSGGGVGGGAFGPLELFIALLLMPMFAWGRRRV